MTNTTWNPSDKSASVVLSGSNLTATVGIGQSGVVRAVDSKNNGAYYFEFTLTTQPNSTFLIGFCLGSRSLMTSNSGETGDIVYAVWANAIYKDGVNTNLALGSLGTHTDGTPFVVGIAINYNTGKVWFRIGTSGNWNGSPTANPAAGVGGIAFTASTTLFPFTSMATWGAASAAQVTTANYGDLPFVGTPPLGFYAGFGSLPFPPAPTPVGPSSLVVVPAFVVPSTPFKVSRSYWTDIITSRIGKEQRRANRNYPRRHFELTTKAKDTTWLKYSRFLVNGQRQITFLPDESRRLTIVSASGSNLVVGSLPNWITVGLWLVIADFVGKTYQLVQVSGTFGGTTILLTTAPITPPAGASVYAAVLGWLGSPSSYDVIYRKAIAPKIAFDEDPQLYLTEPTLSALATFNSREVWVYPPNKFSQTSVNVMSGMEAVDFALLRMSNFDIVGYTGRTFLATWTMQESEADQFRAFFDRMKGQRGEFYMPTYEPDLQASTTSFSGSNTLTIAGTDVHDLFNGSTLYKAVAVWRDDLRIPTMEYNKVSSIAISGGSSVITCANNWTADVTPSLKISWLPVWRFGADTLDMEWIRGPAGDVFVVASMTMRMLEDLTGS